MVFSSIGSTSVLGNATSCFFRDKRKLFCLRFFVKNLSESPFLESPWKTLSWEKRFASLTVKRYTERKCVLWFCILRLYSARHIQFIVIYMKTVWTRWETKCSISKLALGAELHRSSDAKEEQNRPFQDVSGIALSQGKSRRVYFLPLHVECDTDTKTRQTITTCTDIILWFGLHQNPMLDST